MILVDTNVLSDIFNEDPHWSEWSLEQIRSAALLHGLAINGVIYAELSARFGSIENLDAALDKIEVGLLTIPRGALFLAGRAFRSYRLRGGTRTGVLPDFFIGAHAAVMGWPLLTRDARRYRAYFPYLDLIAPD